MFDIPYSLQTALQVYCQAYKQAAVSQAHGLLRKARRLDTILGVRDTVHAMPTTSEPVCYRCHSQFSPSFYLLSDSSLFVNGHHDGGDTWICHKCHFEANEANVRPMGMNVS